MKRPSGGLRIALVILLLAILLASLCASPVFAAPPGYAYGWTYAYDHWNGASWVWSQSTTNSAKNWSGHCYYRLLQTSLGTPFCSAIRVAANTWSAQDSNFYFYELSSGGDPWDHTLGMSSSLGSGTVAAIFGTSVWEGNGVAEVGTWYIRFNSNKSWCAGAVAGYYDRQGCATHELGHAIRLKDLDGNWSSSVRPTMYGYWGTGTTANRSLASGDITGITQLY